MTFYTFVIEQNFTRILARESPTIPLYSSRVLKDHTGEKSSVEKCESSFWTLENGCSFRFFKLSAKEEACASEENTTNNTITYFMVNDLLRSCQIAHNVSPHHATASTTLFYECASG